MTLPRMAKALNSEARLIDVSPLPGAISPDQGKHRVLKLPKEGLRPRADPAKRKPG
jgi:hypothetical protein